MSSPVKVPASLNTEEAPTPGTATVGAVVISSVPSSGSTAGTVIVATVGSDMVNCGAAVNWTPEMTAVPLDPGIGSTVMVLPSTATDGLSASRPPMTTESVAAGPNLN